MVCGNEKCSNYVRLAVSIGLTWALSIFIMGIAATYCDYGVAFVDFFGKFYLGYGASLKGSFIGALWGFVDIFVFVMVVGLIYCGLLKCGSKGQCSVNDHHDHHHHN